MGFQSALGSHRNPQDPKHFVHLAFPRYFSLTNAVKGVCLSHVTDTESERLRTGLRLHSIDSPPPPPPTSFLAF